MADPERLRWWREARFGMFIHWGVYAVAAGRWKGEFVPSLGEWVMYNAKIPSSEYEPLAAQFNPVEFDAEAWVRLAKRAGMKYLVITAKHHDGFAMFDSPSSDYDIVDATPFGRDVCAELAAACARHGLRFCCYYSQSQDWHHPGGEGHWDRADNWHTKSVSDEAFAAYLAEKAKPQVREILTQYGPLGLIWFDTPVAIKPEQSQELADLVHELQPECLVNGRVGNEKGDYRSLGDNQIPRGPLSGAWETPATMNDTWAYKIDDDNWKSVDELLRLLVDLASKGVNYLLNVGPTAEGLIPPESIARLEGIGDWMSVNGEAIWGAGPNPWPWEFEWGRVTAKPGKLYCHLYEWPAELRLSGLTNEIVGARLLARPEEALTWRREGSTLVFELPASRPDPRISVLEIAFSGKLEVDRTPAQQTSGLLVLPGYLADRRDAPEVTPSRSALLSGWKTPGSTLRWTARLDRPGRYRAQVVVGSDYHRRPPQLGQTATLSLGGQTLTGTMTDEEPLQTPRAQYFPEFATTLGEVTLAAGEQQVALTLDAVGAAERDGLTLAEVRLVPAGE